MSMAGSATWKLDPTSNDWNTAANWTPETVPDEPTDVAAFGVSNITDVSISARLAYVQVDSVVFNSDANAYSIAIGEDYIAMTISGAGVLNDSPLPQEFLFFGNLSFTGAASAGDNVIYTNQDKGNAGYLTAGFADQARAGSATFINVGSSAPGLYAGGLGFVGSSSADHSTIINESGDPFSGGVGFSDSSTAGNSTITTYSGGNVVFFDNATGANASLIEDGGRLRFEYQSTGGLARVELLHSGWLDLTSRNKSGPMSIGSLEGDSSGAVMLGAVKVQQLAIGGNGLSTTFSGSIKGGTTGSLLKTGPESLTLSGVNTYEGGTTVEGGSLLVANTKGSATGTGPLQVNAGTFGGRSNIAGAVTIGSGSDPGAFLAPGIKGPGILAIHNSLTFKADGTYNCDLSLTQSKADEVIAKGVTIESGAQFALQAKGNGTLPPGTVFTLIDNKSRQHISGTFANLPDGTVLSVGGNQLQASYQGGDGNDLTLTVVP
jgi:autotransporter-associated beta strand protein